MRGRRPIPTALHRLRGTFEPSRHGRGRQFEPIAEGDLYRAPDGLTASQRAVWRYAIAHAPKGLLRMIDRDMLLIWVEAADRHATAMAMQAQLDRDATLRLLVRGPLGLAPSPYNNILDKTAKTMLRCASELGFSPAARPRIHADLPEPVVDESDPWTGVLRLVPGRLDPAAGDAK
jgi:P27 family predicted phage terminase small subunit